MFSYALRSCRWIICRGYQVVAPILQLRSAMGASPGTAHLRYQHWRIWVFKISKACVLQSVGWSALENQVCSFAVCGMTGSQWGAKAIRRSQDLRNNGICQPDSMDEERQKFRTTYCLTRKWRVRSMAGSLCGVRWRKTWRSKSFESEAAILVVGRSNGFR